MDAGGAPLGEMAAEVEDLEEGLLSPGLKSFLQLNLPNLFDKRCVLGVSHRDLSRSIWKELKINCRSNTLFDELLTGINRYFCYFVYPEPKKKASLIEIPDPIDGPIAEPDPGTFVFKAMSHMDYMKQMISSTSMKTRKWFSEYFPELTDLVADDHLYFKIGDIFLSSQVVDSDALLSLTGDMALTKTIVGAKNASRGYQLDHIDLQILKRSISKILKMFESCETMQRYIEAKMKEDLL